jgi:hypothetical protein
VVWCSVAMAQRRHGWLPTSRFLSRCESSRGRTGERERETASLSVQSLSEQQLAHRSERRHAAEASGGAPVLFAWGYVHADREWGAESIHRRGLPCVRPGLALGRGVNLLAARLLVF